ncbi:hypothetical protein HC256_009224 [Beauveria bassiana]|nr:hypothetical protein HC256_009224 [Beauveria bassiana]
MKGSVGAARGDERVGRGRGAIDLDAAALGVEAVVERQAPATLVLGGADPGAQQVARGLGRQGVDKGGAGVEGLAARDELHIADVAGVLEAVARARRLEDVHGLDLRRGKGRDKAGVAVASEGLDKKTGTLIHGSWPAVISPLRSKYQMGEASSLATSGRSLMRVFQTVCADAQPDKPPVSPGAQNKRPTMSASSVWKS